MSGGEPVGPDEQGRRLYAVGVVKISSEERDVARAAMPDHDAARERDFQDVIGADTADDDARFPASSGESLAAARAARDAGHDEPWRHLDGAATTYGLWLTDEEAAAWAAAPRDGGPCNRRYIEIAHVHRQV